MMNFGQGKREIAFRYENVIKLSGGGSRGKQVVKTGLGKGISLASIPILK
jgi:hypothetical protein